MGFRRQSREYAIEIIYQISMQNQSDEKLSEILNDYWSLKTTKIRQSRKFKDLQDFTTILVKGVVSNMESLDKNISSCLDHSNTDQVSIIDKSILRMALFEMFHLEFIPYEVSMNEAIEIGKKYGTKKSHCFINGILDAVYKIHLKQS